MAGMLLFAYLADRLGRRLSSVVVSVVMLVGAVLMITTPGAGESIDRLFVAFSFGFSVLGLG